MSVLSSSAANRLKSVLKQIEYESINLNHEESKQNFQIVEQTKEALLEGMKIEDPLFNALYQKTIYSGSYFKGVKITSPDEFDLDIVLRLPFQAHDVQVVKSNHPSYIHYQLRRTPEQIFCCNMTMQHHMNTINSFFDDQLCLLKKPFRSWIEEIVKRCPVIKPPGVANLTYLLKGVTFEFCITTTSGKRINFDFVPVIDGSQFPFPPGCRQPPRFRDLSINQQAYIFALSSPPNNGSNSDHHWHVSFPEAEKALIHTDQLGCIKLLMKLLKLMRDAQEWDIKSYEIMTLVMWDIDEHPNSWEWSENNLGHLFIQLLEKLKNQLDTINLRNYYAESENLWSRLTYDKARRMADSVQTIIYNVVRNPEMVKRFMQIKT